VGLSSFNANLRNSSRRGFFNLLWPKYVRNPEAFYCPLANRETESVSGDTLPQFPASWSNGMGEEGVRSGYTYSLLENTGRTQTVAAGNDANGGANALIFGPVTFGNTARKDRVITWDFG